MAETSSTDQPWLGDACSLVDAFRSGDRSPREELEATLAAIESSDLNAFSHIDPERARRAADEADVNKPFGGVPFAIKELDEVEGWPDTGASLVFKDRKATHTSWAIERVLGSFARTLVVPERHYRAAAEFIDEDFLGARLVYEKVDEGDAAAQLRAGGESLLAKLELADGPYQGWLGERLAARFDYACVESTEGFARHAKAVTRRGQVKHSAALHEKDDRRRVDDRSRWVLGCTTETKEAELERLLGWYAQGYDVVIGSRGLQRANFGWYRRLGSAAFRGLRRLLMLRDISDTQCGFKSMRREVALHLFPRLDAIRRTEAVTGWKVTAFDVELLYLAERAGYRIAEVTVAWENRDVATGKGKSYLRESKEMGEQLCRIKWNELRGRYD